ncbi:hypothetical protein ACFSOX_22810 [Rhodoplanes azumiensis]|uniref:Restriction endonuclease n=1 Tax=Rhodoplanes azumiensis TaxID=1897628 RepID=A0ABW5APV3_9BRAD
MYVHDLAPDFAYVHWREEYGLERIETAYGKAFEYTKGFQNTNPAALTVALSEAPESVLVFRLLLGLTVQELAAATVMTAELCEMAAASVNAIKNMEAGRFAQRKTVEVLSSTIDAAMRNELFATPSGSVKSKLEKPDTIGGWDTVRNFATDNVPFPVFLHQRHYGGAFRQLLDATSGKRGDILEDAVEELFRNESILYVKTGSDKQEAIERDFGLSVKPAPDFVVYDANQSLRAILECKQANDGEPPATRLHASMRFARKVRASAESQCLQCWQVSAGAAPKMRSDRLFDIRMDASSR